MKKVHKFKLGFALICFSLSTIVIIAIQNVPCTSPAFKILHSAYGAETEGEDVAITPDPCIENPTPTESVGSEAVPEVPIIEDQPLTGAEPTADNDQNSQPSEETAPISVEDPSAVSEPAPESAPVTEPVTPYQAPGIVDEPAFGQAPIPSEVLIEEPPVEEIILDESTTTEPTTETLPEETVSEEAPQTETIDAPPPSDFWHP